MLRVLVRIEEMKGVCRTASTEQRQLRGKVERARESGMKCGRQKFGY